MRVTQKDIPASIDIRIDKEFRDLLPPLTDTEYEALEKSIVEHGCREPLTVWSHENNVLLLGGYNRFAICMQHQIDFEIVQTKDVTTRLQAKIWILKDQINKRNLSDFNKARLVLLLKDLVKIRAKQNQLATLKQYRSSVLENSPKRTDGLNTREVLAKLAGVSSNTLAKIEFIDRNATPEQIVSLVKGDASINKVHHQLKHLARPEIEGFIKKFNWSVKKQTIPLGNRLLDYSAELNSDQKTALIHTLLGLREFSNKMIEMLQNGDIKKNVNEP